MQEVCWGALSGAHLGGREGRPTGQREQVNDAVTNETSLVPQRALEPPQTEAREPELCTSTLSSH